MLNNIITFKYTDKSGRVSHRDVYVTEETLDKISGIDVGELPPELIPEFQEKMQNISKSFEEHDDLSIYIQESGDILDSYDLNQKYRQFIRDKMENIETPY